MSKDVLVERRTTARFASPLPLAPAVRLVVAGLLCDAWHHLGGAARFQDRVVSRGAVESAAAVVDLGPRARHAFVAGARGFCRHLLRRANAGHAAVAICVSVPVR